MPELPEVEAARQLVHDHCVGKRIVEVIALEQGRGPRDGLFDDIICAGIATAGGLQTALVGRTLTASNRKGKQMWWELSGAGLHPTWHFGMTGAFSILNETGAASGSKYKRISVDVSTWPPKFTKVEVVFEGGLRLAFTDPRRLGRVRLLAHPLLEPPLSELGPDPLLEPLPLQWFTTALAGRHMPIKALLLDQSFIAGIGNWIADECLYQAAIHPETLASALSTSDVHRLHAKVHDIVGLACSVGADSSRFPLSWLFHYRWGKGGKGAAPKTSEGHAIEFITVGGRTSAVVRVIQGTPHKTARKSESASSSAKLVDDSSHVVPMLTAAVSTRPTGGHVSLTAAATPATTVSKPSGRRKGRATVSVAPLLDVATSAATPTRARKGAVKQEKLLSPDLMFPVAGVSHSLAGEVKAHTDAVPPTGGRKRSRKEIS